MKIHLKDFLVDSPDRSSVTKIFRSDLEGDIRGHLVILLSIKAKGDLDVNQVAPFIINGVGLGAKSAESPIACLKKGLEQGERQLRELIRHDDEAELGLDVNLSMILLQEGKAYIGMLGSHEIRLYHDENLVDVTEILETNNVQTCSLVISDKDYFVLSSSKNFFDQLATGGGGKELYSEITYSYSVLTPGEGILLLSTGVNFEDLDEEIAYSSGLKGGGESQRSINDPDAKLFETVLTAKELGMDDQEEASTEATDESEPIVSDPKLKAFVENENAEEDTGVVEATEYSEPSSSKDMDEDSAVKASVSAPATLTGIRPPIRTSPASNDTSEPEEKISDAANNGNTSKKIIDRSRLKDIRKPLKEFKEGVDFQDIKQKVQTVTNKTQQRLSPVVNKVGTKVSERYNTLSSKVKDRLSDRYGRKLWYKRIMAKLSQSRVGTGRAPGLRLGEYREKANRRGKVAKIALAFVIVAFVFSAWRVTQSWKYNAEVHNQFVAYASQLESGIRNAESKINSNADEAVLALFNLEKMLKENPVKMDELSENDRKTYSELEGRVLGISDKVNKITVLSEEKGNITLFADGRIDFDSNSAPTDIAIFRNSDLVEQLFITDRGTSSVYRIATVGSDVKKIPDTAGVVKNPLFIDIGTQGVYVFDETAGVLKAPFGDSDTEIATFQALSGAGREQFDGQSVDEFAIFTAADNLYVLSQSAGAIYKSQKSSGGSYGLPFVYYQDPRLSSSQDLFADFNIYVLTGGAQGLNRYVFDSSSGKLAEFPVQIAELRQPFENLTAGYTGSDLNKKMYLFDSVSKRLIVMSKPNEADGTNSGFMIVQKQLEYRGSNKEMFTNVSDIVVDEAERFIYVLDGSKVWKVAL